MPSALVQMTTANFPLVDQIDSMAFQSCSRLGIASFPQVTTMGEKAFQFCASLTAADFPKLTILEGQSFEGCASLMTANFPAVTTLNGGLHFKGDLKLVMINLESVQTIGTVADGNDCFYGCTALRTIIMPVVPPTLGKGCFTNTAGGNSPRISIHVRNDTSIPLYTAKWTADTGSTVSVSNPRYAEPPVRIDRALGV
jgi:hypothetical protein